MRSVALLIASEGIVVLNRSEPVPSLFTWLVIALVAIALCVFGLIRFRARKPLTAGDFTKEFANRLRAARPDWKVDIKAERELRITNAKGKESTAFLDNTYTDYVRHPESLPDLVQRSAVALAEYQAEDAPFDRSRIVPIVKDRKWLTEIRASLKARGKKEPPENVFDDLNEQLVVVYAEDNPKSIRYLTPKNLTDLGVARAELRKLAVENLKRMLPKIEVLPGPVVTMIKADGNYEASLLLFDELWSGGQIRVDGDYVVAVPSRDVLLVTGSRNPAGIAKLRELAAQVVRQSSYRLTDDLFVYRRGSFQRLPLQ
jgi:uncharacterized protein YtpQ (UPF0354 family)